MIARLGQSLPQQRPDQLAADVGQPKVPSLEAIGQPPMIQSQQVQDRGLQVVDVDLLVRFGGAEAEFVGVADRLPGA